MVLSWIAVGVLETCAEATAASARTARKHNLFIGINLCQILTPRLGKVAIGAISGNVQIWIDRLERLGSAVRPFTRPPLTKALHDCTVNARNPVRNAGFYC